MQSGNALQLNEQIEEWAVRVAPFYSYENVAKEDTAKKIVHFARRVQPRINEPFKQWDERVINYVKAVPLTEELALRQGELLESWAHRAAPLNCYERDLIGQTEQDLLMIAKICPPSVNEPFFEWLNRTNQ
jgi:hypothetical protein